jgi:alcohol dehydrogenase
MMGLAFAKALFPHPPIVADIDPAKREAALKAGAAAAYDPADREARKALLKATAGGVYGAVDFAGTDGSLAFATGALARGGKVVITGLIGGTYTTPIAMFPLRVFTVEGTMTGTLDEANEMMALARAGKIPAVPIDERPLSAAQASLDDLRAGKVVGRVVLVP